MSEQTFGQIIRNRRHELEITLKNLSHILDVSAVYLSDVEKGNRPPIMDEKLDKLTDYLKLDKQTLLKLAAKERGYLKININDPIINVIFTLIKYEKILTKKDYAKIIKYIIKNYE